MPATPLPRLMVAPNGARLTDDDHPAVPVTIPQIVETAKAAGAPVVAHAGLDESMRMAVEAGVETIEHGDRGSLDTYRLMARRPLLAALALQSASPRHPSIPA